MNALDLIVFLLLCAGLGFVGHLVSPRYGWGLGALLALLVLLLLLIGSFRESVEQSLEKCRN